MEALVHWFSQNLSQYISPEGAVFIISMIPLLELRGVRGQNCIDNGGGWVYCTHIIRQML